MSPQPTPGKHPRSHVDAAAHTTSRRGVLERSKPRRRARAISPHNRKVIARWLRRTATHTQPPHPLARSRETLLPHRVAAVQGELLELAAIVETALDPDPAAVTTLRDLLANGCDSPLYNPDIHVSELRATLYYARSGLTARPTGVAARLESREMRRERSGKPKRS